MTQAFIGIAQAFWAIITIYQARGDQIQLYIYAAFGLTFVPYAFMSVVNAIANLLTPQYATIFVIRTPEMTEAEQRGKAYFRDALNVDLLKVPASAVPSVWTSVMQKYLPLLLGLVPLAIIGGLSELHAGNSTPLQRGLTMTWLVVGIVLGFTVHYDYGGVDDPMEKKEKWKVKGQKNKSNKNLGALKQYLIYDTVCESSAADLGVFFITLVFSPPTI